MGSYIEIDTAQLSRDKQAIAEQLRVLKQSLERIYSHVNELDTMWDGVANDTFRAQFEQDKQKFMETCNLIDEYVQKLEFAKHEYDECEMRVNAAIGTIGI